MSSDWEDKHKTEEYSFLQETRKDEQVRPKALIADFCKLLGKGLIFGIAAGVAFSVVKPWAEEKVAQKNAVVTLPKEEETPEATKTEVPEAQEFTIENYREMSKALKDIADEANKSVVTVEAVLAKDNIESVEQEATSVSGVIIWKNAGEILVLAPLRVLEDSGKVEITFADHHNYTANLKKLDKNTGLAVFSIPTNSIRESTKGYVKAAVLGNSRLMSKGMSIIVLGNPFGYAGGAGYGIVSSTDNKRVVADGQYEILTTDVAAAENGSGILFDIDGELIGIADQIVTGQGSHNLISGYGISGIKNVIEKLSNGEGVPYLGIRGIEVTEEISTAQGMPQGIYVKEVEADSPAMKAGIQSGDIIVRIGEKEIKTIANMGKELSKNPVGQEIKITIHREGMEKYEEIPFGIIIGSKE